MGATRTGVAHALIAELGVGTVTASALQLGLALAGLFAGVGATFLLTGIGLVWATRPAPVKVPVLRPATVTVRRHGQAELTRSSRTLRGA